MAGTIVVIYGVDANGVARPIQVNSSGQVVTA